MTIPPAPPQGPILLVESDRRIGQAIAAQLAADGFAVELAHTAEHARVLARERSPALALLGDLREPGATVRLLQEIRRSGGCGAAWDPHLPAIVLAALHRELDSLRAFDAGADDFLARPAGYLELRARLKAVLRRVTPLQSPATLLEVNGLVIDMSTRATLIHGRAVALRRMEFDLLAHLAQQPERVFTREELLGTVWGYRGACSTRTLDSHASRLRRKLAARDSRDWVINVRGVGYRLT